MGEMQEKPDIQLLGDYAKNGQESAFREIVTRYTDLVYSAAVRQVESSAVAGDIAQSVFTDLAHKAGALAPGCAAASSPSLAGWLHRATRYAALNHLRDTRRRLTNERQAMEQLLVNSESPANWEQIRPALDEAIDSLGDEDREAVLLRYFKNQDYRAVGQALGISDDAAQKRVSRAVERLREVFAKRGVAAGATGLAIAIAANAVQAAPTGLAATLSAAALAGTTVSTSAVIATTKVIAMTTLQKTLVTATVAVLAGAGIYESYQASRLREQNQTLQQQQAPLTEQIQQLQEERNDATNRLAGLSGENSLLRSNLTELVKLRGDVQKLRQQTNDLSRLKQENRDLRSQVATTSDPTNQISSDDQLTLLKTHANDAMTTLLAAVKDFATNNNGQYPTGYEQLMAAGKLKSTNFLDHVGLSDFEFVQDGSVDPQGNKIVLSLRVSLHESGTPATRILGAISPDGVLHTEIFNESE